MTNQDALITTCQHELVEDHHSFGSGRYGLRLTLPKDISPVFPYLNSILSDTVYDHENSILIGFYNKRRYAFRPHEIQVGMIADPSDVPGRMEEVVNLINNTWENRNNIEPSLVERKVPPAFEIYKMLPRTNCKKCGYQTCLAFAADLRSGAVKDACTCLSEPEYSETREKLIILFPDG